MKFRDWLLSGICVILVCISGCTGMSAPAAAPVSPPDSLVPASHGGCTNEVCNPIPPASPANPVESIRIGASPVRYSPMMSSTPGMGLTLNTTGFNVTAAEYLWSASYGRFLSWNPPDYTVQLSENKVKNHGEKLYWTFTDKPGSTDEPVRITVTARDPLTRNDIASAELFLEWEGDTAVIVRDSR